MNLYADAGVREYWIVDPVQKSVHVYFLEQESFKVISYTFQDSVKVNIYEDLWIDFKEFGLGLYISDYFMREMGGELLVENGEEGLRVTVVIRQSGI